MIFVGIDVKAFVVVALVNVAAVVDVVVVVVVDVVAIVVVVVLSFRKPIKPTFYQEGEYLVSLFPDQKYFVVKIGVLLQNCSKLIE